VVLVQVLKRSEVTLCDDLTFFSRAPVSCWRRADRADRRLYRSDSDAVPAATTTTPPTHPPISPATEEAVLRRSCSTWFPEQSGAFRIDDPGWIANNVVGVTSDVRGDITGVNSPETVAMGPIVVDLSTLATDKAFRNRAIHDAILQTRSEANRFATFQLTSVEGMPSEVVLGTAYDLSLTGDLTIHGVTRPVTFAAVVTPVSETRLEGSASVSLPFSDFDVHVLRLPPQVASIGEVVTLEIDFVAEAG
jgi:polyisoprenoid-binding protein YceI